MSQKVVNKIQYIDIAKGLAIIAVVIGHSLSPIRGFIYLFHVPLFFFLSGFLYKDIYSSIPLMLFWKRIKSLYFPFLFSELVFFALHNTFFIIGMYSLNTGLESQGNNIYVIKDIAPNLINIITFGNIEPLLVPLWFLTSLFTVNILFCLLSFIQIKLFKIHNEYLRFLFVIICVITGIYLTYLNILLPRQINTSLVALGFFYSGYIYKRFEKEVILNSYLFVIFLLLMIISSFYVTVEMVTNRYSNVYLFYPNALIGIYCVIYISKLLEKNYIFNKFLSFIGNNSIYILIFHLLAFKLVHYWQIQIYNYPISYLGKTTGIRSFDPWWILYTIIGVFLPLLILDVININKRLINNLRG